MTSPVRRPAAPPRPAPRGTTARPVTVMIAAGFLCFASLVWLGLALAYHGDRGAWYPAHLVASAVVGGVAAVGLLRMKRWAVILFAAFALALQIGYAFTTLSNFEPLVWSTLILVPCLFAWDRMT